MFLLIKYMDKSMEVFYDDLLDKILDDLFEDSYTEFDYEFKERNELFNHIQNYIQDPKDRFFESFEKKNALYNIRIKSIGFIECYKKSVPAKHGRYHDRYVIKFVVFFIRNTGIQPFMFKNIHNNI